MAMRASVRPSTHCQRISSTVIVVKPQYLSSTRRARFAFRSIRMRICLTRLRGKGLCCRATDSAMLPWRATGLWRTKCTMLGQARQPELTLKILRRSLAFQCWRSTGRSPCSRSRRTSPYSSQRRRSSLRMKVRNSLESSCTKNSWLMSQSKPRDYRRRRWKRRRRMETLAADGLTSTRVHSHSRSSSPTLKTSSSVLKKKSSNSMREVSGAEKAGHHLSTGLA